MHFIYNPPNISVIIYLDFNPISGEYINDPCEQMIAWVKEIFPNAKVYNQYVDRYHNFQKPYGYHIFFKNKEDQMAFKLRWI